jgi:serine/threonine-protein kinase
VAGTGHQGSSGDGGPATAADVDLGGFGAIAIGADGSLYLAESWRIRRVDPDGIITTVAGGGTTDNPGDGGPAVGATIAQAGIALAVSSV